MKRNFLPHIASRLLNVPLMIAPDKLETILHALGPRVGLEGGFEIGAITDMSRSQRYREYTGDGIGLIPVMGPLAYNLSFEDAMCSDIVSYRDIKEQFIEALNDPLVSSILFDFDSPGGEVAGCFDLVDLIYQSRGIKPIYAMVDESAFSAAYALASAASKVFIPRTGGAGSIGVIAQFVEQSVFDEAIGVKYTSIFAGARKNDFNPHNPISNEAQATLQNLVNADYQIFTETAARNRGMTVEAIRATEAGIYQGEAAVKAGLADAVMSFDQAIEYIESQNKAQGGQSMKIFGRKAKVTPEASQQGEDMPENVVDLDVLLEKARAEGREQGKAEALSEVENASAETAKTEAAARISAIMEATGAVKGLLPEGFAEMLIKSDCSIEDARVQIIDAIAKKSADEAPDIKSTLHPNTDGGISPLVRDAQRRAETAKGGK